MNKACAIGCLIRDAFLCLCVYTNLKHLEFREKVFALLLTSGKDFNISRILAIKFTDQSALSSGSRDNILDWTF